MSNQNKMEFVESSKELYVGEKTKIFIKALPTGYADIKWTSSDNSVARVAGAYLQIATVVPEAPGTAVITMKCNKAVATCTVTVKEPEIRLRKKNIEFFAGKPVNVGYELSPSNDLTRAGLSCVIKSPATGRVYNDYITVNGKEPYEGILTAGFRTNMGKFIAKDTCHVKINDRDDAVVEADTIPETMVAGNTYDVSVTMKNTGYNTWIGQPKNPISACKLTTEDDNGDMIGRYFFSGFAYVLMAEGARIYAGESYTFKFQMKAPKTPGTYPLQLRMLERQKFYGEVLKKTLVVTA